MRKWIPLLIVVAAFIASAVVFPRLPETMPTHFDMSGQPNGWSSRFFGAWVMPLFLLCMWGLVRVLPAIDPRGDNYAKFGGAFEGIIVSIMLFMFGMHIIVLRAALGYPCGNAARCSHRGGCSPGCDRKSSSACAAELVRRYQDSVDALE